MRPARLRRFAAVVAALVATAPFAMTVGPAAAGESDRPTTPEELKSSVIARGAAAKARVAGGASVTALPPGGVGNGIFQLYVEQSTPGNGTFTVLTGPNHPAGPGLNVLFGNGIPGTSYLMVKHVTVPDEPGDEESTRVYVQGPLITHEDEISLDESRLGVELGTTGYEVGWSAYFGYLYETVEVHGSTLADTSIEVTTRIEPYEWALNDRYQIQHIWDVAAGADDGPVLQTQQADTVFRPFAAVGTTEHTLNASENHVVVADNDANPVPPNLGIAISSAGPSWLDPTPTPPDSVKYVCWPQAVYAPIGEYEVDETYDVSTPASSCTNSNSKNDSAVVSLWSVNNPGGPTSVTQTLFSSPRTPYPTVMTATPVLLNPPVFTATLRDTGANKPLVGRTVSFVVGNTVRCSAVTDATGTAGCGTLVDRLAAVLALGYTARYAGNAIWAPASKRAGIL
ncbi:hypothetical protein [Tenggerimyces flavus]|uniref:Uncharacterized protein n=1 Tax=Tenggerimyces flavus TaxID=1708749 RepID=A0ABV7YJW7_9ACTN|nr:hypothetical protein [Tenggerimyces flavus]MBM7784159.1 hypothetical protein [Tenggerimyces flavus]